MAAPDVPGGQRAASLVRPGDGPVEPGLLALTCGEIAAGGACVARGPDGRVVFVRHALPGEQVLARITSETSSYLRADAVSVLEPAAERVEPPCHHAGPGRCGGCDFQHAEIGFQRQLKARLLGEQLRRVAGVSREVEVEAVGAANGLAWRTRVRFGVDASGRVGLRRHRSHDLELVEHCPIASEAVEAVGVERRHWPGAREVEVFALAGREGERAASLRVRGRRPRRGVARGGPGDDRRSAAPIEADVLGEAFRVSLGSFFQAHADAPGLLAGAVLASLEPRPGEHAADLYAGVGIFAVHLAHAVASTGRVTAVERDRTAVADLRHNAREVAGLDVRAGEVSPELIEALGALDVVVLDPPREGAGRAVMSALVGSDPTPRRVAYVSCDAATFARDLRVALEAGWTMPQLRAFDLFPMTEHLEILAVLEPPHR